MDSGISEWTWHFCLADDNGLIFRFVVRDGRSDASAASARYAVE